MSCDQVKETGDHGVFNSWGRNQYITTERTGKPSIVPAENRFSQNFIISNYSSIFPFDHDDGAENAFFFELAFKTITLPRQAQDKDERTSNTEAVVVSRLSVLPRRLKLPDIRASKEPVWSQ